MDQNSIDFGKTETRLWVRRENILPDYSLELLWVLAPFDDVVLVRYEPIQIVHFFVSLALLMHKFTQEADAFALILVEIKVKFDRIANVQQVIVERLLVEALADGRLHERKLSELLMLDPVLIAARLQMAVEV